MDLFSKVLGTQEHVIWRGAVPVSNQKAEGMPRAEKHHFNADVSFRKIK